MTMLRGLQCLKIEEVGSTSSCVPHARQTMEAVASPIASDFEAAKVRRAVLAHRIHDKSRGIRVLQGTPGPGREILIVV